MLNPDLGKMKYAVVERNTVISYLVDLVQLSRSSSMNPFERSLGWVLRVGTLLLVCNDFERLARVVRRPKLYVYHC